jgi:hypothetical protein
VEDDPPPQPVRRPSNKKSAASATCAGLLPANPDGTIHKQNERKIASANSSTGTGIPGTRKPSGATPLLAVVFTFTVRTTGEVPLRVAGLGDTEQLAFAGVPVQLIATAPEKPPLLPTVRL